MDDGKVFVPASEITRPEIVAQMRRADGSMRPFVHNAELADRMMGATNLQVVSVGGPEAPVRRRQHNPKTRARRKQQRQSRRINRR